MIERSIHHVKERYMAVRRTITWACVRAHRSRRRALSPSRDGWRRSRRWRSASPTAAASTLRKRRRLRIAVALRELARTRGELRIDVGITGHFPGSEIRSVRLTHRRLAVDDVGFRDQLEHLDVGKIFADAPTAAMHHHRV